MTDQETEERAEAETPSATPGNEEKGAGKHAALPRKAATAGLLMPSVLTGVAVALVVAQYQPLVFNPDAYASTEQATAEIKPVEVTAERQDAQPTTDANYSAADYGIDASNLKDGTYTGSGQGFKSTITVAVTISGGKIVAIEIVSAGDDEPYFSNAKGLISSVIAAQSTSVDTISGATYSSKGILVAIKNALEKAAGGTGSDTGASSAPASSASGKSHATLNPTQVPADGYADGTYYGEGEGYKSTIRVAVTITGGKISKIDVLSQDDDAAYFNRAKSLIATVVDKQTTAVDTVSGATFSSEGILAAVENALRQAAVKTGNNAATDKPAGDSDNTGSGDSPSKPDVDEPSQGGQTETRYLDGDYTVYVKCENTEDPDAFEPYYLAMTVTVENGKASAIKDVHGTNKATDEDAVLEEYDESNDAYLEWAAFGRVVRGKEYVGVVKQLIDPHAAPSNVDVVSRSTYSSKAIVKAYEKALELANEAYKKANPSDDAATGDAGGSDAASGKDETGSASNSEGGADRA